MNKKLLAVAIGAALSAPMLVQADVKIGGSAQVEIAAEEVESTVGTVTATDTLVTTEDNSRGRFWITADEDLGNGMKGLAHFEFRVDTTGVCESEAGGSTCGTTDNVTGAGTNETGANVREKYVGLQTKLGTVKLGSIQQPYKYAGGVKWDAFVTTNLEARGNGGMSGGVFGHNNFFDNSLLYTSPSFAGVSFGVAYSFDDVAATSASGGGNASTADDGDYSAAVEWNGKFGEGFGVHLIAALSHNADNTAGSNFASTNATTDQTKIGAKFTFAKNYSVIAQYEQIEGSIVSGVTDIIDDDVYFLAFHATIGPVLLALQYGNTEEGGVGTNRDIDYLALGAFYNFSKTFSVFGGYRATNASQTLPAGVNDVDTTVYTLGMRKNF